MALALALTLYSCGFQTLEDINHDDDMLQDLQARRQQKKEEVYILCSKKGLVGEGLRSCHKCFEYFEQFKAAVKKSLWVKGFGVVTSALTALNKSKQ